MVAKIIRWVVGKGKVWIVRVVAFLLTLFSTLSVFDIINKSFLKSEYVFPAIFALLWLFFEAQISFTSESTKETDLTLLQWTEAVPQIVKSISAANNTLHIIGSSTESMFLPLKETLEKCKNTNVFVLMRKCEQGDSERISKLNQYRRYWEQLSSTERKVKVKVKFYPNDILRSIIIDSSEGFLGFFEKVGERLWGHSVPLMHVKKGSRVSDYLLRVYLNRFTQMWKDGDENVCSTNE